jgi:hypothetical protein
MPKDWPFGADFAPLDCPKLQFYDRESVEKSLTEAEPKKTNVQR